MQVNTLKQSGPTENASKSFAFKACFGKVKAYIRSTYVSNLLVGAEDTPWNDLETSAIEAGL
jgi:hypothetical protein